MSVPFVFKSGANRGIVRDSALRARISTRVARRFARFEPPGAPAHVLGWVNAAGRRYRLVVSHAVDLVVLGAWGGGQVALIRREFPPGAGRLALPGGMIDAGETPPQAAARECAEEIGYRPDHNALAQLDALRANRPFDIRLVTWCSQPREISDGVFLTNGDLLNVTTTPFGIVLPRLSKKMFRHGDDASAVEIHRLADLSRTMLAAPDHMEFIQIAAAQLLGQSATRRQNQK